MSFDTYLRPGQAMTLRSKVPVQAGEQVEEFRGVLQRKDGLHLELKLAGGGGDAANLGDGVLVEMISEHLGLGLRFTAISRGWAVPGVLRLESREDLEIFYRRLHRRADLTLWLGLRRAMTGAVPLHDQWLKALARRGSGADPTGGAPMARCPVNLGSGGIRLELTAPVNLQDGCLFFLLLEDNLPAVCALGEVVWVKPGSTPEHRISGLRFAGILAEDQQRIDRLVTEHCRTQGDPGKSSG